MKLHPPQPIEVLSEYDNPEPAVGEHPQVLPWCHATTGQHLPPPPPEGAEKRECAQETKCVCDRHRPFYEKNDG